jgi:hypothetical protein
MLDSEKLIAAETQVWKLKGKLRDLRNLRVQPGPWVDFAREERRLQGQLDSAAERWRQVKRAELDT